jgi:hypothetical protein
MSRFWARAASIAMAVTVLSCSSATEPLGADVDFARTLWLGRHPRAYSFEVQITAFYSTPGYFRVQVSDGQVVDARDPSGQPVADFTVTVDGIWDALLAARAKNELNSATFGRRGVPAEVDVGPWPLDGGTHYSVRNFAASQ